MNRLKLLLFSLGITMFFLCSCSIAEDPIPANLYGTWSDQQDTRHIEITFNNDRTGSFLYSSRAYYRVAGFHYYMKKGVIYCDGVMEHENGDIEDPWHLELQYNVDHLIPLNSYGQYTLCLPGTDINRPSEPSEGPSPTYGKCVDLGLSVKWAGWNVGATCPEESGGYYSWGELLEKNIYSTSNYEHYKKSIGKNISGTRYDVARAEWGEGWRLPTDVEMRELVEKCYWSDCFYKGVRGNMVQGPNGNKIFIPLCGYMFQDELEAASNKAYLWSSISADYMKNRSYGIYTNPDDAYFESIASSWGINVRPVSD